MMPDWIDAPSREGEPKDHLLVRGRSGRVRAPKQGRAHLGREIIETVVLALIMFLVVRAVAQPYRVEGESMRPGLQTGDLVLISPIAYAFGGSPQHGDVVVLKSPVDPSGKALIKRIIGVPGDIVSITPNSVIVDGKQLSEAYLYGQGKNVTFECGQNFTDVKVGPDEYLVLGDNRGDSLDSRCFGSVPRQNILGKATLMIWPLNQLHWLNTYSSVFAGIP
jgi:signal peptidase I